MPFVPGLVPVGGLFLSGAPTHHALDKRCDCLGKGNNHRGRGGAEERGGDQRGEGPRSRGWDPDPPVQALPADAGCSASRCASSGAGSAPCEPVSEPAPEDAGRAWTGVPQRPRLLARRDIRFPCRPWDVPLDRPHFVLDEGTETPSAHQEPGPFYHHRPGPLRSMGGRTWSRLACARAGPPWTEARSASPAQRAGPGPLLRILSPGSVDLRPLIPSAFLCSSATSAVDSIT